MIIINIMIFLISSYIFYMVSGGKVSSENYWLFVLIYWGIVSLRNFIEIFRTRKKKDEKEEYVSSLKSENTEESNSEPVDMIEHLKEHSFDYEVNKIDAGELDDRQKAYIKYMRILNGIEE